MKITHLNRRAANTLVAAVVALIVGAPTAQAARAKKQAYPAPVAPATVSPYSYEFGIVADYALNPLVVDGDGDDVRLNTIGADITGVYKEDENGAYTLRLGVGYGTADKDFGRWKNEWTLTRVSLMPGYRYTHPWGENTKYFLGANVGLVYQRVEREERTPAVKQSVAGKTYGIGYSAEVGIRYSYSEATTLVAALQLSGSSNEADSGAFKTNQQMYCSLRVGFSGSF